MTVLDINVLAYAHREDEPRHRPYADWLLGLLRSQEPFAIPAVVATGFVRIVTHDRIYDPPSPPAAALRFVGALLERPNHVPVEAGPRHWAIFRDLCLAAGIKGPDVTDAHLAALTIEAGATLASSDEGFARFKGLRWRRPVPGRG